MLTSVPQQPQTEQRKPFIARKDEPLISPGTARATITASRESPNGTVENDYAAKHQDQIVIQQHCEFFDPDYDGMTWPQDTYVGFGKLGMHRKVACAITALDQVLLGVESVPCSSCNLYHQLQPFLPNLKAIGLALRDLGYFAIHPKVCIP